MTFKLKARAQAEELLTTSWTLIHSPEVSPAVKADLIESTVKWGGLEPKNDTAEGKVAELKLQLTSEVKTTSQQLQLINLGTSSRRFTRADRWRHSRRWVNANGWVAAEIGYYL